MSNDRFFFPFFWKDFQVATSNWTDEQVGAYLRLLIIAWDKEGLPFNEGEVQALGNWSDAAWRRIWLRVGPKFEVRDGRLVNLRMEEIRIVVMGRSASAKVSAAARWAKDRSDAHRSADGMRTHSDGTASKEDQIKDPPPTPPPAEGPRTTRAERKAALRAIVPDEAPWRLACAAAGHKPPCGTPRACTLLLERADTAVPA